MSWFPVTVTLAAYALGSVSFGLIFAKRAGVDLRSVGSGNVGATNAGRAMGRSTGRLVLVLDALKGALPVLLMGLATRFDTRWMALAAWAAVVGHCWPIWHGLRGGKGAATAAGAMLVLAPVAGVVAIVVYAVTKRVSRKVSVGSLAGASAGAAIALMLDPLHASAWGAVAIACVVWVRHADNLARLRRGEEPDG